MENWLDCLKQKFGLDGKLLEFAPYGEGHINRTYLLVLQTETDVVKYIVQQINDRVFKNVDVLMSNISAVIDYIGKHTCDRHLQYVPTIDGESYWYDGEGYFRVYDFIDDSTAYQLVEKPEHFFAAAQAFAGFQNALAGFDASRLVDVIPDFHDTEKRFEAFSAAVSADICERAASASAEIGFVQDRKAYCGRIVSALKSGVMPTRVTHNDTKLNNVLIDNKTGEGVVIDLDTVMAGAVCYDFGDSIRSGCNSAAEDEPDLDKVHFRLDLFEIYARGYISTVKCLEKIEKSSLAFGSILMTYECGMRFLADYLSGDTYFRTKYAEHNLVRARTQFKLVEEMESCLPTMEAYVEELS